jgi:hypothetical protein
MANYPTTASNYPGGFNNVTIRGVPIVQSHPGQVFWVYNGPTTLPGQIAGSDGNPGTFNAPFATLQFALNRCVDNRGDVIFIKPMHAETIANATTLALNTSGVAIIGLGSGVTRPTFTFTTAASANIPVQSANVAIQNCLFLANFADIASVFTAALASVTASIAATTMTVTVVGSGTLYPGQSISGTGIASNTVILNQLTGTTGGVGTYTVSISQTFASGTILAGTRSFTIDRCEFRDLSTILNFLTVFTAGTGANSVDGLMITNSQFNGLGSTAATALVTLDQNVDRITIQNCYVTHALAANSGLILLSTTSRVLTRLLIDSNVCNLVGADAATGVLLITAAVTNTGVVSNNFIHATRAIASAQLVSAGSKLVFFQNFYNLTDDKSGVLIPTVQT